jgi:hypothetical protein
VVADKTAAAEDADLVVFHRIELLSSLYSPWACLAGLSMPGSGCHN